MTKFPSNPSDFANLRPGWLVGYRDASGTSWEKAEVIANNPQDGHLIILVGDNKLPVTLDLNRPEDLQRLGAPF